SLPSYRLGCGSWLSPLLAGEYLAPIERILVPLDLNRLSEAKIPIAEAQAQAFGAEIILLHVLASERPGGESISLQEAQARTYLDMITTRLRSQGIKVHAVIRSGPPADTI